MYWYGKCYLVQYRCDYDRVPFEIQILVSFCHINVIETCRRWLHDTRHAEESTRHIFTYIMKSSLSFTTLGWSIVLHQHVHNIKTLIIMHHFINSCIIQHQNRNSNVCLLTLFFQVTNSERSIWVDIQNDYHP